MTNEECFSSFFLNVDDVNIEDNLDLSSLFLFLFFYFFIFSRSLFLPIENKVFLFFLRLISLVLSDKVKRMNDKNYRY